jgi:predicted transcriptional regulator of viral defense system
MPEFRTTPRHLPDALLSEGVTWATTDEIARRLAVPPERVKESLKRARAAGRIVSITQGAWLVVPPEYLRWGAPPPTHFVDAWMRHLGHPYYVGLLAAAAHHGLAHHAPQVFHVVTPARLKDRKIGRARVAFVHAIETAARPTDVVVTPTGRLVVASLEVTLLDLVVHPHHGGGLDNVATIVANAVQEHRIDAQRIVDAAATYRHAAIQRLGYLVELAGRVVGTDVDLEPMAHHVHARRIVTLSPRAAVDGATDLRWRVQVNVDVDVET